MGFLATYARLNLKIGSLTKREVHSRKETFRVKKRRFYPMRAAIACLLALFCVALCFVLIYIPIAINWLR